jgi:hypothetical protein
MSLIVKPTEAVSVNENDSVLLFKVAELSVGFNAELY